MKSIKGLNKRALLVILDGYGLSDNSEKNAVKAANTPNIDSLLANYPNTTITTGGLLVGLPEGSIGNSEVGHMNIGAGKPIKQDLVRINEAVENGTLKNMPKLKDLIENAKSNSNKVHLMGLLSDGGVHSHINHIKKIIEILRGEGIQVYLHAFMDGRDTARDCGHKYVDEISKCEGLNFASMHGRAIAMDRDKRYEKIKQSYDVMIGKGKSTSLSPAEYIQESYKKEIYDEFVEPALFNDEYAIKENDCVFFVNYRPDRAIQMSQAMTIKSFKEFDRPVLPKYFLCMTPYIADQIELPILFNKEAVTNVLSEYVSNQNIKQLKIAETEKYAHVTFFMNGGRKEPFPGEERILIQSPRDVNTYDEKPEMSAFEVLENLLVKLNDDSIGMYIVNFANPDMVGHTGNFEATVKAVETVDQCIGQLVKKCEDEDIAMLITSDHGNSDTMAYDDGNPHTSHTNSPVPFIVVQKDLKGEKLEATGNNLALKDIAPTILSIMGLEIPDNFEGKPIFK